jgi:TolB-like protein
MTGVFIRTMGFALTAAALAACFAPASAQAAQRTVLVLPFENQTGNPGVDWLGEGVADLTIERLEAEPALYTFSRDERVAAYRKAGIPAKVVVSRATAIRLGWESGADVVIVGVLSGTPADFGVQARLIDLAALNAFDEATVAGKLDGVMTLVRSLSGNIAGKLAPAGAVEPPLPKAPPPSAFEKYVRGLLSEDPARRIAFLKEAVRLDPGYPDAIFELGRAYHEARDYKVSREWIDKIAAVSPNYSDARFLQGLNGDPF